MGAGNEILEILKRLEQKIDAHGAALEALRLRPAPTPSSSGSSSELDDRFLDSQRWTDMDVRKDPPRWTGPPMIGRNYSQCPGEWHDEMASFLDWKASKGREENPPRLQTSGKNAGKPWYEADEFGAKICRAWARRNRGKSMSSPASAETPQTDASAYAVDDLPF